MHLTASSTAAASVIASGATPGGISASAVVSNVTVARQTVNLLPTAVVQHDTFAVILIHGLNLKAQKGKGQIFIAASFVTNDKLPFYRLFSSVARYRSWVWAARVSRELW